MIKKIASIVLSSLMLFSLSGSVQAEKYKVDPVHSAVEFTVTHMKLAEVDGQFKDFSGEFNWDKKDPSKSSLSFVVQAKSVTTSSSYRDDHLRSPDFFDVAKYPTLAFKSSKISALGDNRYSVTGDLTIHGVTQVITVPATVNGPVNAYSKDKLSLGFRSSFKIDRMDFKVGATWKGGSDSVVSHDVFITIKGEANEI